MSVICDRGIQKLVDNGLIDFNLSETDYNTVVKQINSNTMDLTLGKYIRWPVSNMEPITLGGSYEADKYWDLQTVIPEKGVMLMPGDIFLGCSREFFCMPSDICGQVFTKSSVGRLFINHMMAGVIDAGFHGTITLELKNEGKHNIIIPYGARVVQIQLSRLEEKPERDYSARSSRYNGQIRPEPAREEKKNFC